MSKASLSITLIALLVIQSAVCIDFSSISFRLTPQQKRDNKYAICQQPGNTLLLWCIGESARRSLDDIINACAPVKLLNDFDKKEFMQCFEQSLLLARTIKTNTNIKVFRTAKDCVFLEDEMDKIKFLMLEYKEDLKTIKTALQKETEENYLEKNTVENFCKNSEVKDLVKENELTSLYQAINKVRPELNLIPPSKLTFSSEKKPKSKSEEKNSSEKKEKALRRVVSDSLLPRTFHEKEQFQAYVNDKKIEYWKMQAHYYQKIFFELQELINKFSKCLEIKELDTLPMELNP